ncbi:MAG: glutamate racemase [bacterium]|nr:glutamate racemase [bacterium]
MIGVFDSGIGGLTVMRELLRELPECGYVYLGDTARVPYGSKGPETIRRYAREGAEFLLNRGARVLVVACNTMSAVAAGDLRTAFPHVPIVEVVVPAVEAALATTRIGRIGVLGTRATITSGVYEREITHRQPTTKVVGVVAPLLVPLVEEGWLDAPETVSIIRTYLTPLREADVDTVILGCTHYPLLEPLIAREMGERVTIVNPARAVAAIVRERLERDPTLANACQGTSRTFSFTDTTPHTERVASEWLGVPVTLERAALPAAVPFTQSAVLH